MSVAFRIDEPEPEPGPAPMTRREWLVLAVLLAVGLTLRVREAVRTPFWFDELFTLWMAGHRLPDMLRLLGGDIHPPLPTLLVALWRAVGGEGTLWLKTLPMLIGSITLAATYGFTRDLFGRRVAALATALLAIHPMHVYFSQEIRSYGLLALALLLSAWGAWRWSEWGRTRDGALWAFGMALTLHTHYLGAVVLAFLDLWVLAELRGRPRQWRAWALIHLGTLVLVAPLAGMLPSQLLLSRNHWLPHPPFAEILDYLRKVAYGAMYMVPVLGVVVLAALRAPGTRRRAAFLLWLSAAPLVVAFVLTHYGAHLYAGRYWYFLVPLWCVLFAAGFTALPPRAPRRIAAALLVLFAFRANLLWRPMREAVTLHEVAEMLAPNLHAGDVLFCADTHSLITLDHHLGTARGVLVMGGAGLPYYLGGVMVPESRRVAADSVIAADRAGRRWWAVRTREGGMSTVHLASMMDSLARGGVRRLGLVTVWAGRPGMFEGR